MCVLFVPKRLVGRGAYSVISRVGMACQLQRSARLSSAKCGPMSHKPRTYTIAISGLPLSANDRRRATWQQVYRQGKVVRDAVAWQARTLVAGMAPLEHAHVLATLYYRRKPFRDPDSAAISCKELV